MTLPFPRSSLRVRLALLFGLGVVAVGVGQDLVLSTLTQGWLRREIETRARTLADSLATRVAAPVQLGDRIEVERQLTLVAGDADVTGAALYAADGRRVAEAGSHPGVWRALPWNAPKGAVRGPLVRTVPIWGRADLEVVVPVNRAGPRLPPSAAALEPLLPPQGPDERIGWVRLVVSRARQDAIIQAELRIGLIVLLASLLVTLLPLGLLLRRLLSPLREASTLAREIAAGRLDRRLPVRRLDELGTLAQSLNTMASGLEQARAQARAEASALRVAAEAVIAIARHARTATDTQTVFEGVAVEMRRVTGCSGIALASATADGDTLALQRVDSAPLWRCAPPPTAVADELRVLLAGSADQPVRVALGTRTDPLSRALVREGQRVALLVPLVLEDAPQAALMLVAERAEAFPDSEIGVVAGLASHLSSALRASLLRERLRHSLDDLEETRAQLLRSERLRVAGQMASGIAHDFNNVLGAIQGRAQLLRRRAGDPSLGADELARSLEVIEQAARDGAETVRRLRQFGRPSEAAVLDFVDLGAALREATEFTRVRWENEALASGRRIEVVHEIDPGAWVTGRGPEFREIFTNLLLNAVDAMPAGGTIRLGCVVSGGVVRAWVEDSGTGMPEEVRRHIFDPFFTTKGERGTGLGLSVVYGIVKRHHGSIAVRSVPGSGTRIEMSFPLAQRPETLAEREVVSSEPVPALDVLVVDDDPAVRGLLTDMLTLLGHRVVDHGSAETALEFFERGRFDLVLTDLGLQGMSGWDLAKRLRAGDATVTIAFVTGWGDDVSMAAVEEAGANGFIGKPFAIEDVEGLTRLAAQRREPGQAAA